MLNKQKLLFIHNFYRQKTHSFISFFDVIPFFANWQNRILKQVSLTRVPIKVKTRNFWAKISRWKPRQGKWWTDGPTDIMAVELTEILLATLFYSLCHKLHIYTFYMHFDRFKFSGKAAKQTQYLSNMFMTDTRFGHIICLTVVFFCWFMCHICLAFVPVIFGHWCAVIFAKTLDGLCSSASFFG